MDIENNHYPRRIIPSRIEAFKYKRPDAWKPVWRDIMQDSKTEVKAPTEKKKQK